MTRWVAGNYKKIMIQRQTTTDRLPGKQYKGYSFGRGGGGVEKQERAGRGCEDGRQEIGRERESSKLARGGGGDGMGMVEVICIRKRVGVVPPQLVRAKYQVHFACVPYRTPAFTVGAPPGYRACPRFIP